MLEIALLIASLSASSASPNASEQPATSTKVVVKYDSPHLPADSPDRLPRTIWRSGKNRARIEGVVSAETGHRILVVTDSPHLWLADLDSSTGYHTVDPGPDIGADVPVFPVPIIELEELQIGSESSYFTSRKAKAMGRTVMNGRACDRQDIEGETYLLIGCFEPMTGRPVALGLRIGEQVIGVNYLEYEKNVAPPPGAFAEPPNVKFTERPHTDTTHAAQ